MLPPSYFDRLTNAMGLRTDRRGLERRASIRIPAAGIRPDLYAISGGALGPLQKVRARDISASGIGILVPATALKPQQFVVSLRPSGSEESFVLLCKPKRVTKLDGSWAALGLSFESLLAPGQTVSQNVTLDSLYWLDVSGTQVPDEAALAA